MVPRRTRRRATGPQSTVGTFIHVPHTFGDRTETTVPCVAFDSRIDDQADEKNALVR